LSLFITPSFFFLSSNIVFNFLIEIWCNIQRTTVYANSVAISTCCFSDIMLLSNYLWQYCLCDLVVRIPSYRSRGPGSILWLYQIFWELVGLERGPFSLLSTTEELLGRNSSGSGHAEHPAFVKVCTNFADKRRSLGRYSLLIGLWDVKDPTLSRQLAHS
jgi:hypothetical protein